MLLKIAVFVLIFAILFLIREAILFGVAIIKNPDNYRPTTLRLVFIALALSYVFTIIFTGFTL